MLQVQVCSLQLLVKATGCDTGPALEQQQAQQRLNLWAGIQHCRCMADIAVVRRASSASNVKTWPHTVLHMSLTLQSTRLQGAGCHQTNLAAQLIADTSERGLHRIHSLKLLRDVWKDSKCSAPPHCQRYAVSQPFDCLLCSANCRRLSLNACRT